MLAEPSTPLLVGLDKKLAGRFRSSLASLFQAYFLALFFDQAFREALVHACTQESCISQYYLFQMLAVACCLKRSNEMSLMKSLRAVSHVKGLLLGLSDTL
jgi:hypothetical protein